LHSLADIAQPHVYVFNPQQDEPVTEEEYADILFELLKLKSDRANLFTSFFSDHALTSWDYEQEVEALNQQRKFMEYRLKNYFDQQDKKQDVGKGFTKRLCPLADIRDASDDNEPHINLKKKA
jgi:hypothetical protein